MRISDLPARYQPQARARYEKALGRVVQPAAPSCNMPVPEPRPKYRSKTEARYADELERQRLAGEIREWWFEDEKVKLPSGSWYCIDFRVEELDGSETFIEIKGGFKRKEYRLGHEKFKEARAKFHKRRLEMWQWAKGEWRQIA